MNKQEILITFTKSENGEPKLDLKSTFSDKITTCKALMVAMKQLATQIQEKGDLN